jgi:hypothetical protein
MGSLGKIIKLAIKVVEPIIPGIIRGCFFKAVEINDIKAFFFNSSEDQKYSTIKIEQILNDQLEDAGTVFPKPEKSFMYIEITIRAKVKDCETPPPTIIAENYSLAGAYERSIWLHRATKRFEKYDNFSRQEMLKPQETALQTFWNVYKIEGPMLQPTDTINVTVIFQPTGHKQTKENLIIKYHDIYSQKPVK